LPLEAAYQRMREEPRFGSELIGLLTSELAGARAQLAVLNRRSAIEKLAAFILDLWRRKGSKAAPARLTLELSRGDIADFLGLTIETVSRCLTKLKVQGVIELPETHTLLIKNLERLEHLAVGSED
jgi:CRP-like cAMP-binding protein